MSCENLQDGEKWVSTLAMQEKVDLDEAAAAMCASGDAGGANSFYFYLIISLLFIFLAFVVGWMTRGKYDRIRRLSDNSIFLRHFSVGTQANLALTRPDSLKPGEHALVALRSLGHQCPQVKDLVRVHIWVNGVENVGIVGTVVSAPTIPQSPQWPGHLPYVLPYYELIGPGPTAHQLLPHGGSDASDVSMDHYEEGGEEEEPVRWCLSRP